MILYFVQDCLEKSRKILSKDVRKKDTGALHSPGAKEEGKKCQEFIRRLQQMARLKKKTSGSKAGAKISEQPWVWSQHPVGTVRPKAGAWLWHPQFSNMTTPQVADFIENATNASFQMSNLSCSLESSAFCYLCLSEETSECWRNTFTSAGWHGCNCVIFLLNGLELRTHCTSPVYFSDTAIDNVS